MRREIRPMTVPEIEKWYAEELAEAFAPAERKPLADILSLRAEGRYELLGLFNERDELLGYATIWRQPDGAGLVLLDYLGVSARLRNGGLGAEIWATGGSSEKTGLLLFQNRYDPPAAPTPTPAPAKTTPVPAHPAPKPALPQTADPMPVTLLAVLAVLSAGGLMGLYYNKYGRKERK